MKLLENKPVKYFIERLPPFPSILGVYAVIVLFVYSWTLFVSFYKFPSWIQYLTIGQILTIYAYSFSTNFLESLFFLVGILLLDFTIFLAMKNRGEFLTRYSSLVIVLLISAAWRLLLFQDYQSATIFVAGEKLWWTVTILLAMSIAILAPKIKHVSMFIENIAERAIVLLYIYLPLGLISLAVVVIRNLR